MRDACQVPGKKDPDTLKISENPDSKKTERRE